MKFFNVDLLTLKKDFAEIQVFHMNLARRTQPEIQPVRDQPRPPWPVKLWGHPSHMGVSENVVYPIVPNGFADHYPYEKWLAIIGNINPTFSGPKPYQSTWNIQPTTRNLGPRWSGLWAFNAFAVGFGAAQSPSRIHGSRPGSMELGFRVEYDMGH